MSDSGSPSITALAIAEARSSVGFSRRDAVSAVKYWNISSSADIWSSAVDAALELVVVAAEQFLRELEHHREVGLRHAEQRHDHVQRVIHRDLLDEVALRTDRRPSCRRRSWPARRCEPSSPAWPSAGTSRRRSPGPSRCCGSSMWISVLTPTPACSSSSSAVTRTGRGELVNTVVGPLDVHDVRVLGDRPERLVARHLDPRHRGRWHADESARHERFAHRCRPSASRKPWRLHR